MKKLMMLALTLMLCVFCCGQGMAESAVLPVKLLEQTEGGITMEEAMTLAQCAAGSLPAQHAVRAELAELSDGRAVWIVTTFDTAGLQTAYLAMMDAATGDLLDTETADGGFFVQTYLSWEAQKGPHALWTLEDKQLYDHLYALLPSYGLPEAGDMSAEEALAKALNVLGRNTADGYSVGYGYLMGGEGYNGVWEISLVIDGNLDHQVNLDAVTGEVYYLVQDQQEPDGANG